MATVTTGKSILASMSALARIVAGPLALLGFFLPWAAGPGLLAATDFTGFKLVQFAGRLQALELPLLVSGPLLAARMAILLVAVAAVWLALLAPWHRAHRFYRLSGWYLTGMAAVAVLLGIVKSGVVVPPAGLRLWLLGVACFIAGELLEARRYR